MISWEFLFSFTLLSYRRVTLSFFESIDGELILLELTIKLNYIDLMYTFTVSFGQN